MLIDFISANAAAIVAAVVLVPVLAFSVALFIEGARKPRWTSIRRSLARVAPLPQQQEQQQQRPAAGVSLVRQARPEVRGRAAIRSEPSTTMGGHGLRHGIAARMGHD